MQHPVAGLMAEKIIDALEAIQIQVHQGLGLVAALVAHQGAFGSLIEATAVEQPGQGVGDRLELQLLVQVAHHRHVQHRDHHGALAIGQRRARQRHRHRLATRRAQQGVVQAEDLPIQVGLVESRIAPQRHPRRLHEIQQVGTLQHLYRRFEQL
ncbi:hypothetical protein D3C79_713220 [compost metagenome]